MHRPTTPPILPAFPPPAGMQEEWASVLMCLLALHLLHQRHEAVGVECGTVELVNVFDQAVLIVGSFDLPLSFAHINCEPEQGSQNHAHDQRDASSKYDIDWVMR